MLAWPSARETTSGRTPAASAIVANECRVPRRTSGRTPAALASRTKRSRSVPGCTTSPLDSVRSQGSSIPSPPCARHATEGEPFLVLVLPPCLERLAGRLVERDGPDACTSKLKVVEEAEKTRVEGPSDGGLAVRRGSRCGWPGRERRWLPPPRQALRPMIVRVFVSAARGSRSRILRRLLALTFDTSLFGRSGWRSPSSGAR